VRLAVVAEGVLSALLELALEELADEATVTEKASGNEQLG